MKTIKLVLTLLLEDACQMMAQYFYFEKVLLSESTFVYFNAAMVFISAAFSVKVSTVKVFC